MSTRKECYLCRKKADAIGWTDELPSTGLHKHHIVFGTANRKVSDYFGLWVWVCADKHHEHGDESPHQNRKVALMLIDDAKKAFIERYGAERWREEFGKEFVC